MGKMSTSEAMRYFRSYQVITMLKAKKDTGLSGKTIKSFAEYAGTRIVTTKNRKEYCAGAPEACTQCPFSDCISSDAETEKEKQLINDALYKYSHKRGINDDEQED